ncbi:MAG: helix-turn-helix domain-containing protein [Chloroflexi bacterium]|nr:helix-turn-helix domain-containing protein [Chloroflexota bacterium]
MNNNTKSLDDIFEKLTQNPKYQQKLRRQAPYYDLVAQIVNRRVDLRLTQKELAKKANTYQSRISKLESGEHDFRLSTIIQIAEALETQVSIRLIPFESSIQSVPSLKDDTTKLVDSLFYPNVVGTKDTQDTSASSHEIDFTMGNEAYDSSITPSRQIERV